MDGNVNKGDRERERKREREGGGGNEWRCEKKDVTCTDNEIGITRAVVEFARSSPLDRYRSSF